MVALPDQVLEALPRDFHPDDAVALAGALERATGRTYLVRHGARHLLLTQVSVMGAFQALHLQEPATLERQGLGVSLRLVTLEGTHHLPVTLADRARVQALLEAAPGPHVWGAEPLLEPDGVPWSDPETLAPEEPPRDPLRAHLGQPGWTRWGSDARENTITALRARAGCVWATCHAPGVRVWSQETGELVATLAPEVTPAAIDVDARGDLVCLLEPDGHVSWWLGEEEGARLDVGARAITVDPGGAWVAWAREDQVVIDFDDTAYELPCPGARWLSTNGDWLLAATDTGSVYLWEIDGEGMWREERERALEGACLSPDGRRFALLEEGVVHVYRADDGVHELQLGGGTAPRTLAMAWRGASLVRVTEHKTLEVVDLEARRRVLEAVLTRASRVLEVDEAYAWVGARVVDAWDLEDGVARPMGPRHTTGVRHVLASGDGLVMTSSMDGALRAWDEEAQGWSWVTGALSIATPDGARVVTAHEDRVELWARERAVRVWASEALKGGVRGLGVSADGGRVVWVGRSGEAWAWDVLTQGTWALGEGWVTAALEPRGKGIALAGREGVLEVVEPGVGVRWWVETHEAHIAQVAWGSDAVALAGEEVSVWRSGEAVRRWPAPGGRAWSVGVSPNGALVVAGGANGEVAIWEVGTGELVVQHAAHALSVTAVAFGEDGRTLVTGSSDMTAKVWDVEALVRG